MEYENNIRAINEIEELGVSFKLSHWAGVLSTETRFIVLERWDAGADVWV